MSEAEKKVIIVGSSGCGKTTLFQFLTSGEVSAKPQSSTQCAEAPLRGHAHISIVDTPGLESDDDEWWDLIQNHQKVHMVIIMFNGTNDRLQNLNKLSFVHKYLQRSKQHLKVLAIKGNNFEHEGWEYSFLTDHTDRFRFNTYFTSASCIGQVTRDEIYAELSTNLPDIAIELCSPLKLIASLDQKNKEITKLKEDLAQSTKRADELNGALMDSQKQYAALWSSHERTEVISQGYEMALQRARSELLTNYCVVDDRGNIVDAKTDAWGWHLVSWLPFAGNFILEQKKASVRQVANIARDFLSSSSSSNNNNNNRQQQQQPPQQTSQSQQPQQQQQQNSAPANSPSANIDTIDN